MSGGPVSRRRFLGAAAALSSLPAVEGAATQDTDATRERGDSSPQDEPVVAQPYIHLEDGCFGLLIDDDDASAGEISMYAFKTGELTLAVPVDDIGSIALSLTPDDAEQVAALLGEFAEKARSREAWVYP